LPQAYSMVLKYLQTAKNQSLSLRRTFKLLPQQKREKTSNALDIYGF